ncbi:MAG TPA: hypothetical protein VFS05_11775 [Gemmatimonadaceae bacterium]|nr:hypothetical protein [Gemmatimonadaceae bacterium]
MPPLHPSRFVPLLLILAGCSGSSESGARTGARRAPDRCADFPTDGAYREATLSYIADLTPKPRRFLNPVGTDSTLPGPAFDALLSKGPSYFYPADSAGRMKVREKLDLVGPWATLLVAWGGAERLSDTTAVIRLRGHYVIGEGEGTQAPARALRFVCGDDGWRLSGSQEERST